jgi:hypothetical protein
VTARELKHRLGVGAQSRQAGHKANCFGAFGSSNNTLTVNAADLGCAGEVDRTRQSAQRLDAADVDTSMRFVQRLCRAQVRLESLLI